MQYFHVIDDGMLMDILCLASHVHWYTLQPNCLLPFGSNTKERNSVKLEKIWSTYMYRIIWCNNRKLFIRLLNLSYLSDIETKATAKVMHNNWIPFFLSFILNYVLNCFRHLSSIYSLPFICNINHIETLPNKVLQVDIVTFTDKW